jgi:cyclic pyranopterin phosphate synthase
LNSFKSISNFTLSHHLYPQLIDKFGRTINYLRLGITDRCNLKCVYCIPEKGISYLSKQEILSFQEIKRLINIFIQLGITKIRFTGGEPFIRKGFMKFLSEIRENSKLEEIYITTNGVLTVPFIPQLKEICISGINLSLDTLKKDRFFKITRYDLYDSVYQTFIQALRFNIPLKVNTVIQEGLNTDEIISISQLARDYPVEVRFIEEMPFGGKSHSYYSNWTSDRIYKVLQTHYHRLIKVNKFNSTASIYKIPGFEGTVGVIGGYSRLFCQDCNRIRVTPKGNLKTCLYDNGVEDLRELLRNGSTNFHIKMAIRKSVLRRFKNGLQTERVNQNAYNPSMVSIGG